MLLWALFELSASRWFPASSAVYLDARSLAKIFPSPRARTYIASRVPSATTESRTTRSTIRGSAAFRAATRRAARSVNDKATNCHAFSTRLDRDLVQWGMQTKQKIRFFFSVEAAPLPRRSVLGARRLALHPPSRESPLGYRGANRRRNASVFSATNTRGHHARRHRGRLATERRWRARAAAKTTSSSSSCS